MGRRGQRKRKTPAHSPETFVELTPSKAINTRLVVQKCSVNNSGETLALGGANVCDFMCVRQGLSQKQPYVLSYEKPE